MEEEMPIHSLQEKTLPLKKGKVKEIIILAVAFLLIVAAGTGSGLLLTKKKTSSSVSRLSKGSVSKENIKKGEEFGLKDQKTFKDSAIGVLKEGGVDGEGTHHLEREGGVSQNVYLTSSVLDLEQFVGRKVTVWGETFSAQKAGWLMDVGKLKVLN